MSLTQWVLLLAGVGAVVAAGFMASTIGGLIIAGVFAIVGAFLVGDVSDADAA